jgi:hypothetical protein
LANTHYVSRETHIHKGKKEIIIIYINNYDFVFFHI